MHGIMASKQHVMDLLPITHEGPKIYKTVSWKAFAGLLFALLCGLIPETVLRLPCISSATELVTNDRAPAPQTSSPLFHVMRKRVFWGHGLIDW